MGKYYKCSECPYGLAYITYKGHGAFCKWPGARDKKQPVIFYGKTAPKTCPLKLYGAYKED